MVRFKLWKVQSARVAASFQRFVSERICMGSFKSFFFSTKSWIFMASLGSILRHEVISGYQLCRFFLQIVVAIFDPWIINQFSVSGSWSPGLGPNFSNMLKNFPGIIMKMTVMTPFQEHIMEIRVMVKLYMFMDSMLQQSTKNCKLKMLKSRISF